MNAPTNLPRQLNTDLDPEMPANRIVIAFGGARKMSELTGFAISTIYAWQKNGLIPAKWKFDEATGRSASFPRFILTIAEKHEIGVTPEMFIEDAA